MNKAKKHVNDQIELSWMTAKSVTTNHNEYVEEMKRDYEILELPVE
jgi:hypothetical protein